MTKKELPSIHDIVSYDLEDCTPSQLQAMDALQDCLAKRERLFLYWMGGVRAGKSYGAAILLNEHIRNRENTLYMVLHYTSTQAINIYGAYIMNVAKAMGYEAKLSRAVADPHVSIQPGNHKVLLRGADKMGRDKNIQGLTLDGLIVDELPLLNREAVHQAEARVSKPGGMRVYTSNKQSPYHWTVDYYVKRIQQGKIKGVVLDCDVTQNQHIDQSYIDERMGEYEGKTLTRFIKNDYSLDNDPIFKVPIQSFPNPKGKKVASLFAHEFGLEVIEAIWLDHDGKKHLWINNAISVGLDADWRPDDPLAMILLNRSFPRIGRRLRFLRNHVKGYNPEYSQPRTELLSMACNQGLLSIAPTEEPLLQAVNTYHEPGRYDMPIAVAFEALAYQFRHLVSHDHS